MSDQSDQSEVKRTTTPTERLTRLCDAMTTALEAHPEYQSDQCMIFMSSEADKRYGLVIHGYEDDKKAIVDLLMHLRAMFKANGMEMHLVPIGETPEDRRA